MPHSTSSRSISFLLILSLFLSIPSPLTWFFLCHCTHFFTIRLISTHTLPTLSSTLLHLTRSLPHSLNLLYSSPSLLYVIVLIFFTIWLILTHTPTSFILTPKTGRQIEVEKLSERQITPFPLFLPSHCHLFLYIQLLSSHTCYKVTRKTRLTE